MSQPSIVVWWASRRPLAQLDLGALSAAEIRRLDGHRTDPGRERSALARVVLRLALAEATGGDPAGFALDWLSGPRLLRDGEGGGSSAAALDPASHAPPWVSISHSAQRVAVAISWAGPVGVDIEVASRAGSVRPSVIERVTTAAERAAIAELPEADRAAAGLRLWTGKEAVLKATRDGLLVAPHTLELGGSPVPSRLTAFDARPELVGRCHLTALTSDPAYVGCAALLADARAPLVERSADEQLLGG